MTDRDLVTELLADATLRVDVPIDRGDDLGAGVEDSLEAAAPIRYAEVGEIGEVDAGEEGLSVTADCRLTLHVDRAGGQDESAVRDALAAADRVLGIDRFEAIDGPYRIERW